MISQRTIGYMTTQTGTASGLTGTVVQLMESPEYHGNPISSEGSLVMVKWGYDIADYIFRACGLLTKLVFIDNLELGIRAEYIEVLITRKHAMTQPRNKRATADEIGVFITHVTAKAPEPTSMNQTRNRKPECNSIQPDCFATHDTFQS